MKNKILKIKGCKTCKEVLIARIRIDDTGGYGGGSSSDDQYPFYLYDGNSVNVY